MTLIRIEFYDPAYHEAFVFDTTLGYPYTVEDIVEEWEEDGYRILSVVNMEKGKVIYNGIDL